MTTPATIIAAELDIRPAQVKATLELFAEGATVPFVARYRKERTGDLDEVQLRQIAERHQYLTDLEERRQAILAEIQSQGKLTESLKTAILACQQKTELEDLYLPYRPKRRTRATMAKEKGLEPLAQQIEALNQSGRRGDLRQAAQAFVNSDLGVETVEDALQGAADILAEQVAERADLRRYVRDRLLNHGQFTASIKKDYPEGTTKYEMYRAYQVPVRAIASHNLLALLRGDREGILKVGLETEPDPILQTLEKRVVKTPVPEIRQFYRRLLQDAYSRLMKPSLTSEVMAEKKAWADDVSIQTFEANLKNLLLSPPAGMKPTLGVDPGFRTGCKVAAVDGTGKFLEYQAVFPHQSARQRQQAADTLAGMIRKHKIELIAIGNGTASRETDAFVGEVLKTLTSPPVKVFVNESGASIYSASEVAAAEFPDLDVTVRGAISIARRLQDPLAELVKIDPKSIGVGQYQHDVDQKRLRQKLDDTIESCVNYVGVDLNMASRELLTYVSGLTPVVAGNIVDFRNANGVFRSRKELLKVKKLGPKAFEQAAGFLRIPGGKNPLDNTAVHPESYGIVDAIAADLALPLTQISKAADRLQRLDIKKYTTAAAGELTLRDILRELEKPGRDPREQFTYARFQEGINDITDLKPGMTLEGSITNVTNFGAFVDVGVHQDGLVHISQLADRFVSDPNDIVKVGQVVTVRVMEVDTKLKRISLSMRAAS
ncbi:Tex family protein [Nodosilinea nodulosa]|uniref:Tex family protein n=1 Tax=Nodosilinea nodulosa TaxID=416001 RepID=UPI0003007178|nr:Tex family protein [Nodosilinea nodulosa]